MPHQSARRTDNRQNTRNARTLRRAGPLKQLLIQRWLLLEFVRRKIGGSNASKVAGNTWIFMHPLAMAGIYTFVFAIAFGARFGGTQMPNDYTTYVLSGLVPWLGIQSSLNSSISSITSNSSMIKQHAFPRSIIPVAAIASPLFSMIVMIAFVVAYSTIRFPPPTWTLALLPVATLILIALIVGLSLGLSVANVAVRDLQDVAQIVLMAGIFVSPAIYLPEWAPAVVQPLISFNPASHYIYIFQDVLFYGEIAHPTSWIVAVLTSLVALIAGSLVFRMLDVVVEEM